MKIVEWQAKKSSEHSAKGNHIEWMLELIRDNKVMIRCTCCRPDEKKADRRWVLCSQIIAVKVVEENENV